MKKLLMTGLLFSTGASFAGVDLTSDSKFASNCYLSVKDHKTFAANVRNILSSGSLFGQEVQDIMDEKDYCREVAYGIGRGYYSGKQQDQLINLFIANKVPVMQLDNIPKIYGTRTDNLLNNIVTQLDNRVEPSSEFPAIKARISKLKDYGLEFDHSNQISTEDYEMQSAKSIEEELRECKSNNQPIDECFLEGAEMNYIVKNYEAIKRNGYEISPEMKEDLTSKLVAAGYDARDIDYLESQMNMEAKVSIASPLKEAAYWFYIDQMKVLLENGADASELEHIRKLVMDDFLFYYHYQAQDVSLDSARGQEHKEDRDKVVAFIDEYIAEKILKVEADALNACINRSFMSDANRSDLLEILNLIEHKAVSDAEKINEKMIVCEEMYPAPNAMDQLREAGIKNRDDLQNYLIENNGQSPVNQTTSE